MQHTLGRQQFIPQMSDLPTGAAQDRYLQTMPLPQVDVQAGNNQVVVVMLLVDQL